MSFGECLLTVYPILILFNLVIIHQQSAYLVLHQIHMLTFSYQRRTWLCPHYCLRSVQFSSIDGSQRRKCQVFPHFLTLKQKYDSIFLIFQVIHILFFHKGFKFFQSLFVIIRHKIVDIGSKIQSL